MLASEFFNEWLRLTVALKESEKGRLIDAIADSVTNGKMPELRGKETPIFPVLVNYLNEKQKERTA